MFDNSTYLVLSGPTAERLIKPVHGEMTEDWKETPKGEVSIMNVLIETMNKYRKQAALCLTVRMG